MTFLEANKDLIPKVVELMGMGMGRYKIKEILGLKEHQARQLINFVTLGNAMEGKSDLMKAVAERQKISDMMRVSRKETRETVRQLGAMEELTKEMISLLRENKFTRFTSKKKKSKTKNVGIIHLSDIHFNELINIDGNKYDFKIASARLCLLAEKSKEYFKSQGITEVLIAMTGDMINSDRRLDESMNMATNRTKAIFLAVDILQQFIFDLNQDFNISVAHVCGNESRISKDIGWNNNVVTDNYDHSIFYMLKNLFRGSESVTFIEGNPSEMIVNANGVKILLLHGHGCISGSIEKSVEQIKGRYASHGIIVDYVLFGHVHSSYIGDHFSRSSSLCGSNAYNEQYLNIRGRASQNIFIVRDNKQIDGIKIDLQKTSSERYMFAEELEAYNPKSEEKTKNKTTIFEVVI